MSDSPPLILLESSASGLVVDIANSTYAAKNVSNDHDFSKLFVPSSTPSQYPSALPSVSSSAEPTVHSSTVPSYIPSYAPSITPTAIPIPPEVKSCPGLTTEIIANLATFNTSFDYEIVTPIENVSIADALEQLETSMLEHLANSFLSCDGRRRMLMNRQLQNDTGTIVRLSSAPSDEVDLMNVECMRDTGIAEQGNMKCTPIKGSMTFVTDCEEEPCKNPELMVQAFIQKGCEDGVYVKGPIEQVNYIGTRSLLLEANRSNNPGIIYGMPIGLILLIAAAVTLTIVYRRKKRKRNQAKHLALSEFNDDDGTYDLNEYTVNDTAFDWKKSNLMNYLTVQEENGGVAVKFSS